MPQILKEPLNAAVPERPMQALRVIAEARDRFISGVDAADLAARDLIVQRWQRCQQLGIDPETERAPTVISAEQLQDLLEAGDLGRAGRMVLDSFAPLIVGTDHAVVLGDAEGRILYSAGERALRSKLERINFMPGGDWSESRVGPNGVGTPIALGRPELVFGSEHFCQGWQPWICYGSPIRDPDSERILGVVDLTGPAKGAQREAMSLTVSIARAVEQQLLVFHLQRRDHLRSAFRSLERRWPGEGVLIVSASGRLVDLNEAAAQALRLSEPGLPTDASLVRLAPRLWESVAPYVTRGEAVELGLEWPEAATVQGALRCRVEAVVLDRQRLGSALVLAPQRRSVRQGARRPVSAGASGLTTRYGFVDIIGRARALQAALDLARAAARDPRANPVLLTGETGTGKELVAHGIHTASDRAAQPFVVINCGALPRELVESELFGYCSGAFTGARREGLTGKFEAADGGTLFLDEVDSLPLELQAKFLRVLEDGVLTRVGSVAPIAVDVRLVAAGSAELRERVASGLFRLDLFHRLSVIEIQLPPLRQRPEDLELLLETFLGEACAESGREALKPAPRTLEILRRYGWPGNVRELRNLCTRWVLMVRGSTVEPEHLPVHMLSPGPLPAAADQPVLRHAQDRLIRDTLDSCGGSVTEAARRLGLARSTVYRRLKRQPRD